jgi:hypothetical protein
MYVFVSVAHVFVFVERRSSRFMLCDSGSPAFRVPVQKAPFPTPSSTFSCHPSSFASNTYATASPSSSSTLVGVSRSAYATLNQRYSFSLSTETTQHLRSGQHLQHRIVSFFQLALSHPSPHPHASCRVCGCDVSIGHVVSAVESDRPRSITHPVTHDSGCHGMLLGGGKNGCRDDSERWRHRRW